MCQDRGLFEGPMQICTPQHGDVPWKAWLTMVTRPPKRPKQAKSTTRVSRLGKMFIREEARNARAQSLDRLVPCHTCPKHGAGNRNLWEDSPTPSRSTGEMCARFLLFQDTLFGLGLEVNQKPHISGSSSHTFRQLSFSAVSDLVSSPGR